MKKVLVALFALVSLTAAAQFKQVEVEEDTTNVSTQVWHFIFFDDDNEPPKPIKTGPWGPGPLPYLPI